LSLPKAAITLALLALPMSLEAQELEPRQFSPAPVGTSFVLAGVGLSNGAFVLDAAQPIENIEADMTFAVVGAGYTFGMFGRQARVLVIVPYAWGDVSGDVDGTRQTRDLDGLTDARVKLALGLMGAPALTREEFAKRPHKTVLGVSLTVLAPVGQYDPSKLVNLGYNRWGLKPELGASHPFGPWTIEGALGVWFYTTNDAYFPGASVRKQDPIITLQAHLSYTFKSRRWLALDGTGFSGGETETDGVSNNDEQNNTRLGLTFSQPIGKRQSLKFTYSTGATTRRGSDFDTAHIVWQYVGG
jgi:outer membrane putative beta-barrel porin/alpha-amylase